jgi:hypothetical protein
LRGSSASQPKNSLFSEDAGDVVGCVDAGFGELVDGVAVHGGAGVGA